MKYIHLDTGRLSRRQKMSHRLRAMMKRRYSQNKFNISGEGTAIDSSKKE